MIILFTDLELSERLPIAGIAEHGGRQGGGQLQLLEGQRLFGDGPVALLFAVYFSDIRILMLVNVVLYIQIKVSPVMSHPVQAWCLPETLCPEASGLPAPVVGE